MYTKIALFLSALCLSLQLTAATSTPSQDQSAQSTIARGGEYRDESLENRENRAGQEGNTQREQNLENRQQNAENRQSNRDNGY